LASLEHADERREAVRKELDKISAEYRKAAEALSEKRREAARRLVKLVRGELAQLGMEKTRMEVHFERAPEGQGGPTGIDEIEFRISPNPGEELRVMEKIASGGEISRLMLAMKTVLGQARARPLTSGPEPEASRLKAGRPPRSGPAPTGTARSDVTFIFDEVDAGIGGRVAESIGQRLQRLGRDRQVLCVTHLAPIACFADHHFYVEKLTHANRTVTTVKPLVGEKERVEELARMLSGTQITDAARKHAATMLKQAGHGARD
jgi:DNA repair protein RecN (Recombination protein N)